jgi:hypothetical protein
MKRRDAIIALRGQADAVRALVATSLYLIEYDRSSRFSLVELVGIKQLLEGRLGASVDLTTRDSLDPLLRERIEAAAERVF